MICYQISAVVPSTLVMSHGGIIKIPYLRWRSSFIYNLLQLPSFLIMNGTTGGGAIE